MAISKERLEELIKQGATIYSLDKQVKYPIPIFLKDGENVVVNDNELVNSVRVIDKLENLYGTQKQAEWALKYHATRTEELDLPTWEEFKNSKDKCIGFWSKTYDTYWLSLRYDKIRLSRSDDDYECEIVERTWETTEENYAKACDLCLKLFKGEEE